jgi:hypothetical protein
MTGRFTTYCSFFIIHEAVVASIQIEEKDIDRDISHAFGFFEHIRRIGRKIDTIRPELGCPKFSEAAW